MNSRERILQHLAGQPVDRLPVMPITMLVAAEQARVSYREYATDFKALAAGQVRTAEAFGFDFVSVISDPAVEAADCGATIEYFDEQPPAVKESQALLLDKSELRKLTRPDPCGGGRMHNRVKAVAELRRQVGDDLLVEGWVEGPCAEASDLRGINNLMLDFLDDEDFVRDLFEFIVALEIDFARAQVEAGADLIGIGDAAASLVGPTIYEEFIWQYEMKMVRSIQEMGAKVRLHICGQTTALLTEIGKLGCEIVDLDSLVSLATARGVCGAEQIFLGNLDPVKTLYRGSVEEVNVALAECHQTAGERYILGAGCEIPRGTAKENILAFSAYAKTHAVSAG